MSLQTPTKPSPHKIVIVGGGFGGARCARGLLKKRLKNTDITLISNCDDFQYFATLYRLISGHSENEVSIPLKEIFPGKNIRLVKDHIAAVDLKKRELKGKSGASYAYDTLVLVAGSETAYFNIPGIQEHALTMKSVKEMRTIRKHLDATFSAAKQASREEQEAIGRIVVIGGGASGVEIAGELSYYAPMLAKQKGLDPSLIHIELLEALPRVLAFLPENMSAKTAKHLEKMGIRVSVNQAVKEMEEKKVVLADRTLHAHTIIWTAGVKANALYASIPAIETDKKGRAIVDEHLHIKGWENAYAIGDGAATRYSGTAQTAIHDADFVASVIAASAKGKKLPVYVPEKPAFAVPAGKYWAAVLYGPFKVYGIPGWMLRQGADLRAFTTILPLWKAVKMYFVGLKRKVK